MVYCKMQNASSDLQSATDFLQQQLTTKARIAIILGSGLGGFAEEIDRIFEVNTASIPGYPVSTVPGHAGKWIVGSVAGTSLIAVQGRVHAYEGYHLGQVTFPVQLLATLPSGAWPPTGWPRRPSASAPASRDVSSASGRR